MSRRITWCLGCHTRGPWASGRCPACTTSPHRAARKRALYSDPDYRQARALLARAQAEGITLICGRCGLPIAGPFDTGHHNDGFRPEHPACNRSAGGRERAAS